MYKGHASVIACIFQAVGISALFPWYDVAPSTIQSLLDNVLAICQESQNSSKLGCAPQPYRGGTEQAGQSPITAAEVHVTVGLCL